MIRRARFLAVIAVLAAGALGLVSSTQTWYDVGLEDGVSQSLLVPGAEAITVLAPLSLAVLALGAALSIVGIVLRYVFGVLSVLIAVALGLLTGQAALAPGAPQVASTVTAATGISGDTAVSDLVATIAPTAWPTVALVGWAVLLLAGALTLATAHRWRGGGRRYRTDAAAIAASAPASRPHDAIDDWDDLSRGEDPTARPLD